jgi:hypothetical protein
MTESLDPTPRHNSSHHPSGEWETMFQLVRDTRSDVRENRKETDRHTPRPRFLLSTQVAVLINDSHSVKKMASETDQDVRSLATRVGRLERAPLAKDRKAAAGMISGLSGLVIGLGVIIEKAVAYFSGSH